MHSCYIFCLRSAFVLTLLKQTYIKNVFATCCIVKTLDVILSNYGFKWMNTVYLYNQRKRHIKAM